MITTFRNKLRMASLEDHLHFSLGLRPGMAVWMTRMAWDLAGQNNINLLAYRGDALLEQFISLLDDSSYRGLLDLAAEGSPRFHAYVDRVRGATDPAKDRVAA